MFINVKVISRASKNEVSEKAGNEFLIKITSVPEKGKANKKIIELLSEYFGVSKSDVVIIRGEFAAHKTVEVKSVTAAK